MPVTVTLWDDTFAQTLEFDLDNSEVPKGQVAVIFRVGIAPPLANGDDSLRPPTNVVCDPMIEGEAVFDTAQLTELAEGMTHVADYLSDAFTFAPHGADFALRMSREVLIPHVQMQFEVDGNVFLDRNPGLPGHITMAFNFWTTVESLRAFAAELDAVVRAFEGRGSRSRRGEAAARAALELQRTRDAGDEGDDAALDLGVQLFWEDLEEPLRPREALEADEAAWEQANEEWLSSYLLGGRRTHASNGSEDELDDDDAAIVGDAEFAGGADAILGDSEGSGENSSAAPESGAAGESAVTPHAEPLAGLDTASSEGEFLHDTEAEGQAAEVADDDEMTGAAYLRAAETIDEMSGDSSAANRAADASGSHSAEGDLGGATDAAPAELPVKDGAELADNTAHDGPASSDADAKTPADSPAESGSADEAKSTGTTDAATSAVAPDSAGADGENGAPEGPGGGA